MTMFDDLLVRLRENVRTELPDQADQPMRVPASVVRRRRAVPAGDAGDLPARPTDGRPRLRGP